MQFLQKGQWWKLNIKHEQSEARLVVAESGAGDGASWGAGLIRAAVAPLAPDPSSSSSSTHILSEKSNPRLGTRGCRHPQGCFCHDQCCWRRPKRQPLACPLWGLSQLMGGTGLWLETGVPTMLPSQRAWVPFSRVWVEVLAQWLLTTGESHVVTLAQPVPAKLHCVGNCAPLLHTSLMYPEPFQQHQSKSFQDKVMENQTKQLTRKLVPQQDWAPSCIKASQTHTPSSKPGHKFQSHRPPLASQWLWPPQTGSSHT